MNNIATTENKDVEEWLNNEEIELVKSQFFPQTATAKEIAYCMGVAKSFNLNPILKQIFFVPRKSKVNNQWIEKVEPLVGRDSFLTLAHRSGVFESIESTTEIKRVPFLNNGKWEDRDELIGVCKVFKKNTKKPFKVEVNYSEYVQKKNDGTVTKFWLEKPHSMIKKVAESQCLRKAFDITGLYDETEVSQGEYIEAEVTNEKPKNNTPQKSLQMSGATQEAVTIEDITELYKSLSVEKKSKMLKDHKEWRTYDKDAMRLLKEELEK